jgi:hypothetical protein
MALSSTRARMLGLLGQRRRWARVVDPDARRQATQAARDALAAKYLDAARTMPGGDNLAPEQLAERARQLRLADLAALRIKSWDARQKARVSA